MYATLKYLGYINVRQLVTAIGKILQMFQIAVEYKKKTTDVMLFSKLLSTEVSQMKQVFYE